MTISSLFFTVFLQIEASNACIMQVLYNNGKMGVVILSVFIIFVAILLYLIRIDCRFKKIVKKNKG